jgi:hypothetical protein
MVIERRDVSPLVNPSSMTFGLEDMDSVVDGKGISGLDIDKKSCVACPQWPINNEKQQARKIPYKVDR